MRQRFVLNKSDGVHCAQVLIYDTSDREYWETECLRTGHVLVWDYHVPANAFGYSDPEHDTFQIRPPEMTRYMSHD